jgi:tetratricopeptide (TPR) repeat protein
VRPLTAGERALIEDRMVSTRGVDDRTAAAVLARARRAKVPADDAAAQGWLAEMAFDAGQDDEAEAAADRALAVDPKSVQALMYKGHVRLRRAHKAKATDPKVWAEARSWFVKANRANNNHAGALQGFHAGYMLQGVKPTDNAVAGLRRALELSPQSPDLRLAVAWSDLEAGRTKEARAVLAPLAYSPHAGPDNEPRRAIAMIDGGASGPAVIEALQKAAKAKAAAEKR